MRSRHIPFVIQGAKKFVHLLTTTPLLSNDKLTPAAVRALQSLYKNIGKLLEYYGELPKEDNE